MTFGICCAAFQLDELQELFTHTHTHKQVNSANLSTVEDFLSLHGSICNLFPYCLSHLMFVEIDQSPIKVSVPCVNGQFY